MLSSNSKSFLSSFTKAREEIDRKLTNMQAGFAGFLAEQAALNTPVGDQASIDAPGKYRAYYEQRLRDYALPMQPGFHQGNWQFSKTANTQYVSKINPIFETQGRVKEQYLQNMSFLTQRVFFVGLKGPGAIQLEKGLSVKQAPNGILAPTLDAVRILFGASIKSFYA